MANWNEKLEKWLYENNTSYSRYLVQARTATGLTGVQLAGLLTLPFAFYLLTGAAAAGLAHIIATVYPMQRSLFALDAGDQADASSWLVYWVAYATLTSLEGLLGEMRAPYYLLQTILLVYLWCPVTDGARQLYVSVVRPFALLLYHNKVDVDAWSQLHPMLALPLNQLDPALICKLQDLDEVQMQELQRAISAASRTDAFSEKGSVTGFNVSTVQ